MNWIRIKYYLKLMSIIKHKEIKLRRGIYSWCVKLFYYLMNNWKLASQIYL